MFKCVVHLYGLPYEITALREVEVDLEEGAGMAAVIAALREKIPALEGPVLGPVRTVCRSFTSSISTASFILTARTSSSTSATALPCWCRSPAANSVTLENPERRADNAG